MNKKIFLIIFLIILISFASSKSYTIDKANVEFDITETGTIFVNEYVTFNFNGEFSFAYRNLDKGYWNYSNIKIFDGEKELNYDNIQQNNSIQYKWYFKASNEIKTFRISYELNNAITAYSDISEFYFKVWGNGWEKSVKELTGFILLPKKVNDTNEVYSWGHPEINGKIGLIDNQKLIFQAFNIPAQSWVEIRLLFPAEQLIINKKNEFALERIIKEENNPNYPSTENNSTYPVTTTNPNSNSNFNDPQKIFNFVIFIYFIVIAMIFITMIVYKESKSILFTRLSKIIIIFIFTTFFPIIYFTSTNEIIMLISFLVPAILFILCWYKFGKEPKIDYYAIYERDIPYDYSPTTVNLLLNFFSKTPSAKVIGAEILYLGLKGLLTIEKNSQNEDDFVINLNREKINTITLEPSQQHIYDLLIRIAEDDSQTLWEKHIIKKKKEKTPNSLTISKIKIFLQTHNSFAEEWFIHWKTTAKKEYKKMDFDEKPKGLYYYIGGSIIFNIIMLYFFGGFGIAILSTIIFPIVFTQTLISRTKKGTLHYHKWNNFKRFLQDMTKIQDKPPHSIVLWEKYLVYAAAIGEGKAVEKAIKLVFPKEDSFNSTIFVGTYASFSAGDFASIGNSFSSAFSHADSTSGSSGFSGGGSSGGGGGGGGGGGAG